MFLFIYMRGSEEYKVHLELCVLLLIVVTLSYTLTLWPRGGRIIKSKVQTNQIAKSFFKKEFFFWGVLEGLSCLLYKAWSLLLKIDSKSKFSAQRTSDSNGMWGIKIWYHNFTSELKKEDGFIKPYI